MDGGRTNCCQNNECHDYLYIPEKCEIIPHEINYFQRSDNSSEYTRVLVKDYRTVFPSNNLQRFQTHGRNVIYYSLQELPSLSHEHVKITYYDSCEELQTVAYYACNKLSDDNMDGLPDICYCIQDSCIIVYMRFVTKISVAVKTELLGHITFQCKKNRQLCLKVEICCQVTEYTPNSLAKSARVEVYVRNIIDQQNSRPLSRTFVMESEALDIPDTIDKAAKISCQIQSLEMQESDKVCVQQ